MSLAKSDVERKRLIRKSGLSQKDFLALRRYYISCKKEVYGSDVKLKDIESFAEYIIYMSKLSWRGILLTLFFCIGIFLI